MFTPLQDRLKKAGRWLPVALLPLLPLAAKAQTFNYPVANATNTAGTYTDLGTTGTVITTANNDDANSAATPIGFTFNYNGTAYTQFVLNTNGYLKLGATAPAAPFFGLGPQDVSGGPLSSADNDLLLPFNFDLEAGVGTTEYRVATTGTSPSRVTTIQWKNVSPKSKLLTAGSTISIDKQYLNMNFQVKLYEGSNLIEFVYGQATASTNVSNAEWAVAGIKGTGSTQKVLVEKLSSTAWSAATFISTDYTTSNAFNIRQTALPDAGRTYRFSPVAGIDAKVSTVYTLTKLPIPQGAPHAVRAYVTNNGTNALASLPITLSVTGANTFTNTKTIAALAAGASTTVTFDPYVPTVAGTNTVTVTANAAGDGNSSNNSASVTQVVNATDYSYADASTPTSAVGYPPSTFGDVAFLNRYQASGTSLSVTQVRAFLVDYSSSSPTTISPTVGKTVYAVVLNPTTGALLGRSADYVVTAADVAGTRYTSFTLTTPVAVAAGTDFLVGLAQTYQAGQTTRYYALGVQDEEPIRPNTFYLSSITSPSAPVDLSSGTTPATYHPMIEAVTTSTGAPACTPVSNLTAGSITQTGATITFTAPAGTGGYVVTYTPQGGTATTITPAPTGSPIVLTGLNSGTTYTVSVVTSCSTGANSIPMTTTFTTATPPPTYATLPVTEGFEGTWVSVASTRDVPTNSWRNTPATGDNSWRREDDGFASAGWQYQSNEVPTTAFPTPPYVTRSSVGAHSARFHTFGSAVGLQGKLDLYVNMSGAAGNRVLTFDYINPTGTDKLEVLVSTDGGATFGAPVLTANNNTAFTGKTVTIASTSATTVIRFQATSDFGNDDLGIDNLRVAIVTATRNEALAATVGLYPNPAHQRFSVDVPAGSLHAATATLSNALGQVVLTKQLNLPVAGGTADFDVSRLAAGVYSLQLKSGNDIVVKRVVVE